MISQRSSILAAAALFLAAASAGAVTQPSRVHALVGARVVVATGRTLPEATVVIRDGIIAGVGANLAVPPDARIWDLKGKTLYPGLIDLWTPVAWPLDKPDEAPASASPNLVVRPERDVLERPRDAKVWKELRAAGFSTALLVPGNGVLRGRGAIVDLGDDLASGLLRADAVAAVSMRPDRKWDDYPESQMGVIALLRQSILDARWYRQAQAAYRANPAQSRPPFDAALAALESAAHGEVPIAFESENASEDLRAAAVADEFGLRAWIVGGGDEYRRLDELRAHLYPMILPIAFPERPKVGDGDDLSVSLDDLRHWDLAPANPARLAEAKISFALTTFRQKDRGAFWKQLAQAIERGLPADRALASLTTVPAEFAGLSGRLGTLEAGKIANLVVTDGDLLVAEPMIQAVWVDGQPYPHEADIASPTKPSKEGSR
jgi:imidazolonepropionase-like amidohydrolase